MAAKKGACIRCGKPATETFTICADGHVDRHVCAACDIELNALVLDFMGIPDAAQKMLAYVLLKAGK